MPSLSILLLCWNHRPYLEQCVQSLRDQTSKDFDVVFLDNRSTDGSYELAASLLPEIGVPVTILRNDAPQGVSRNCNRLFEASSGALAAPLSTDDWYAPTYVERMIAAASSDLHAGMFASLGWYYHDKDGRTEPVDGSKFQSGDLFLPFMRNEMPFFTIGCCYRRAVVEEIGGWDDSQPIEDQDFFARMTRRAPVHQVPEPLVYYRRHGKSASMDHRAMVAGCEAFYRKHRGDKGFDTAWWLAERYRAVAASHIDRGELAQAARLLAKAIRLKPLSPGPYRTAVYLARALRSRA